MSKTKGFDLSCFFAQTEKNKADRADTHCAKEGGPLEDGGFVGKRSTLQAKASIRCRPVSARAAWRMQPALA